MKAKKPGPFSRFLGKTFLILNILAVAWLIVCAIVPDINPIHTRYIPLFSLTTPFALLANVFFVFFWLFSRRKLRALLSIAAIAGCYKVAMLVIGLNYFGPNDMSFRPGTVKVMTWNVHGVGIFNRPHISAYDTHIIDYIAEQDADIICLPEFPTPKHDTVKLRRYDKEIMERAGYLDYCYQFDNTLGTTIYLGTAVFSKYPIKNFKSNRLGEYIYLLQGDVELAKGNIVRMYFVHLNTFGLSDYDKAYIEQLKERNVGWTSNIDYSRSFIGKFNFAFARRALEADSAARVIAKSPYPVLVCGDLNDLPGSYTYTRCKADLKDAFVAKGHGFGRTYNGISPTLRIDHIFYDPSALECIGIKTPRTSLSDHNPVIANFKILNWPQG